MISEYEKQAREYLRRYGLTLTATEKDTRSPLWGNGDHGHHYRVTIRRKADKRSVSFDFWGSIADRDAGKHNLTAYDVLACISSEASSPTDADEVAEEFGVDMKPSQAIAIAKFARRLQAFFTRPELEALSEIN